MKYAVQVSSGATVYMQSYIKTGSGIQKLIEEGFTGTQTAW
jgi:hypothetical protein